MLTLTDVRSLTAYNLASYADCGSPDSSTSPGAALLLSVADDVAERVELWRDDNPDAAWSELHDALSDDVSEIADSAPDVYTHTRWQEFVDLAAYNEDPTDLGAEADDLTGAAGACLYIIAERLAWALLRELSEQDDDEREEETIERPDGSVVYLIHRGAGDGWHLITPNGVTVGTGAFDTEEEARQYLAEIDTADV